MKFLNNFPHFQPSIAVLSETYIDDFWITFAISLNDKEKCAVFLYTKLVISIKPEVTLDPSDEYLTAGNLSILTKLSIIQIISLA